MPSAFLSYLEVLYSFQDYKKTLPCFSKELFHFYTSYLINLEFYFLTFDSRPLIFCVPNYQLQVQIQLLQIL